MRCNLKIIVVQRTGIPPALGIRCSFAQRVVWQEIVDADLKQEVSTRRTLVPHI